MSLSVRALSGLYVITDARLGGGHLAMARAALVGGARLIQLRDKNTSPGDLLFIAREMRALTREYGALLLINDQLDLALWCGADGVHLGPDDWPIEAARELLGPQMLIGASCGTPEEARRAREAGADYIGAGAVFGTATKGDAGFPIGLDGLRAVIEATALPVAAIGGIGPDNLDSVLAAGPNMICVISALTADPHTDTMAEKTRTLRERIDHHRARPQS